MNREEHGNNSGYEIPESFPAEVPPHWTSSEGVHIVPAGPDFIKFGQRLLDETWRVKFTRDRLRSDSEGKVPTGGRVTNYLRVENHALYRQYCQRKEAIRLKRRGKCDRFEVATGKLSPFCATEVNEMLLFHGTNPNAAEGIARNDFDMERAGSAVGTMFGPGIYLAEHASKSDEYAQEGEGIFMGQYALLLCFAVAGQVAKVEDKGDASPLVASGFYDCVCGDRMAAVGTFREMIFFSAEPVYCAAIIIYSRKYDPVPATATEPTLAAPTPEPTRAAPTPQKLPDAGPRLWSHSWDFRSAASARVDDSPSLNVYRVYGGHQTPQGLHFNGKGQYAYTDDFAWGGTASVEVYCTMPWAAIDAGADWESRQVVWYLGYGQATHYALQKERGGHGIFQVLNSQAAVCQSFWKPDTWTHVVCVVEGRSMQLYKDGKLMAHLQDGPNPEKRDRDKIWLGRDRIGYPFHGTIAYVRVYDKMLTQQNIQALYENRDVPTPPFANVLDGPPPFDQPQQSGCCTVL